MVGSTSVTSSSRRMARASARLGDALDPELGAQRVDQLVVGATPRSAVIRVSSISSQVSSSIRSREISSSRPRLSGLWEPASRRRRRTSRLSGASGRSSAGASGTSSTCSSSTSGGRGGDRQPACGGSRHPRRPRAGRLPPRGGGSRDSAAARRCAGRAAPAERRGNRRERTATSRMTPDDQPESRRIHRLILGELALRASVAELPTCGAPAQRLRVDSISLTRRAGGSASPLRCCAARAIRWASLGARSLAAAFDSEQDEARRWRRQRPRSQSWRRRWRSQTFLSDSRW